MTNVKFGKLEDLPLREAWEHEAHSFTPWLADNIDRIGQEIGVPLELTGTEVAVENFSADILARNPQDGTLVLIENQLETTDHKHLGQIMTYLAGLEAQTVIWIAPEFREPHLSAIRWLNENTADGFGFFAVRVRVVRIGDSPFAPIFEIVAKPSDWERNLTEKRRQATGGRDKYSDTRLAFWTRYIDRHPDSKQNGIKPIRGWNTYSPLAGGNILVSVWVGDKNAGIYVRGGWGDRKFKATELLNGDIQKISEQLGATLYQNHKDGHVFGQRFPLSYRDEENWDEIIDWMEEKRLAYISAIEDVLAAKPDAHG